MSTDGTCVVTGTVMKQVLMLIISTNRLSVRPPRCVVALVVCIC